MLADPTSRVRVAQWIVDEASISVGYHRRHDTTSLLVSGAMNDNVAINEIAKYLGVAVIAGASPADGRLPTHIAKVQGSRAYILLGLLTNELTGLKALEARAALSFFPPSGIIKGKVTTDVYMQSVWRQFAKDSVEVWNRKRRIKLSPLEMEEIVEAWIANRTGRARRGLKKDGRAQVAEVSISATR
ncbi:MAG: hypothetical protein OK456_05485 [Thaumarchaeota archaeon]|nr:hypothetical protein [Nitrososphaerota archaeon]